MESSHAIAGRHYPGRITFVKEGCIGLFDSIVRNFPEIVITYDNSPVGQNLVLLKGAFLNTGTKDITKEMVAERLTIALPPEYAWLTARVGGASPEVTGAISRSEDRSKLSFDLGLFRCGEYIRFEALAEVPVPSGKQGGSASDNLKKALSFEHRIADTRKIDSREISISDYRRKRIWIQVGVLAAQAIATTFLLAMEFRTGDPLQAGDLQFWLTADNSKTVLVSVTPIANGNLRLRGVKEKFETVMPVEEFFYRRKWKPTITKCYCGIASVLMFVAIILLSSGLAAALLRSLRRESRLRSVLALSRTAEGVTAAA